MRCGWLGFGLLAACSDYDLVRPAPEAGSGGETGAPSAVGWWRPDTGPRPVEEECNGEDDDGDGLVDEDFPDSDGDGVADCVDEDCEVEDVGAEAVEVDETCFAPEVVVTDPWDVAIEWQWTGVAAEPWVCNVMMMPAVGELDDDNGDGAVDEFDTPDVVFVAFPAVVPTDFSLGTLVVLDGATGAEKWTADGYFAVAGAVLADVDGDGSTDIVLFDADLRVRALDATGAVLWTATEDVSTSYPQITVADLDEDGSPEVLADDLVLDGATGGVRARLASSETVIARMPEAGDLDQDGVQEVVLAGAVFDPAGHLLWRSPLEGDYGYWAAILDVDGDPEAEVAMLGGGEFAIYEADGTERLRLEAGSPRPSAPCVADFDGDGTAEIGWASTDTFNLYELDGTPVWTAAIDDSTGLAPCSGFDADGDGAAEVFYADQGTFYVFDGATGAVLYSNSGHASGTVWEYPVIADVDGDGASEAVIASNDYWRSGWCGITAFGHAGDGWMPSGSTWPNHDFTGTKVLADGTVPASPVPWWQYDNVYRARPTTEPLAVDFEAEIVDVCASGCIDESRVLVEARIRNTGVSDSRPGVPVSLYAENGGARTLLATTTVVGSIPSGMTSEAIVFEIALAEARADSLVVVVDDDGTGAGMHEECDEDDNEAAWPVDFGCR